MTRTRAHAALLTLLCAVFAALLVVMGQSPAHAHDRLITSDPKDRASVSASEFTSVNLEFSSNPLKLGNTVRVTDASGQVLFDGEPTVDGSKVRADLTKAPAPGKLLVAWRVVSSDGHPISGELTYTVEGAATNAPASDAGAASSEAPASAASPEKVKPASTEQRDAAQEKKDAKSGGNWWMWIPLLGLGAAAVVAGGLIERSNRKARKNG